MGRLKVTIHWVKLTAVVPQLSGKMANKLEGITQEWMRQPFEMTL